MTINYGITARFNFIIYPTVVVFFICALRCVDRPDHQIDSKYKHWKFEQRAIRLRTNSHSCRLVVSTVVSLSLSYVLPSIIAYYFLFFFFIVLLTVRLYFYRIILHVQIKLINIYFVFFFI